MSTDLLTKETVSNLLDYDVSDDDDPFKDIDQALQIRDDKPTLSPRAQKRKADDDKENDFLGLDEEVKITKKRKPIAKLDETRLLSQPGIPKLRALARSGQMAKKLHLRGKGHEFSDAAKLLNYYQLWLDTLYPRAKFADGLQLVEKAGHSKRMHTMRREWIDEGKPSYARDKKLYDRDYDQDERPGGDPAANTTSTDVGIANKQNGTADSTNKSIFGNEAESDELFFPDNNNDLGEDDDVAPDEDELDALLAEQNTMSRKRPVEPDSEGEDDLDALLAEQDTESRQRKVSERPPWSSMSEEDEDADALLKEQDSESQPQQSVQRPPATPMSDEEDDLDALLAQHDAPNVEAIALSKHSEISEDEPDDLDALLAEHESRNDENGQEARSSSPFQIIGTDD